MAAALLLYYFTLVAIDFNSHIILRSFSTLGNCLNENFNTFWAYKEGVCFYLNNGFNNDVDYDVDDGNLAYASFTMPYLTYYLGHECSHVYRIFQYLMNVCRDPIMSQKLFANSNKHVSPPSKSYLGAEEGGTLNYQYYESQDNTQAYNDDNFFDDDWSLPNTETNDDHPHADKPNPHQTFSKWRRVVVPFSTSSPTPLPGNLCHFMRMMGTTKYIILGKSVVPTVVPTVTPTIILSLLSRN